MSDLEEELRHIAERAADHAEPLAAAEVIRRGSRRQRWRRAQGGIAVLVTAGAVAAGAGVLSASGAGGHPAPQSPAGRPPPAAHPAPRLAPRPATVPVPSVSPSAVPRTVPAPTASLSTEPSAASSSPPSARPPSDASASPPSASSR